MNWGLRLKAIWAWLVRSGGSRSMASRWAAPAACVLASAGLLAAPSAAFAAWTSPSSIDSSNALTSVSCPSASFCTAVDYVNGQTAEPSALTYDGSSWSAPTQADTAGYLEAVSCASSSFCAAIDLQGKAVIYNGSAWGAPTQVEQFENNEHLTSVSCPSASFCAAVDSDGNVATYDGDGWSGLSSIDSGEYLLAVSCASSSFCVALDDQGNALTFNGSSWSSPTAIDPDGGALNTGAVSCPSASFCAAVDSRPNTTTANAITFNGSSWSSPTAIEPAGYYPNSVSCPSSAFCVAVDDRGDALTFNGNSWSSPTAIDSGHSLDSVSCPTASFPTASFCAVVDDKGRAATYSALPSTTQLRTSSPLVETGKSVTLSAMVDVPSGSAPPQGTVTFDDGSTSLGSVDLNGSQAQLTTSSLAAGSHSITANYSGDGDDDPSSSPVLVQGVANPPTAAISAPMSGGIYAFDQVVPTTFSCAEGTGGPGLQSCNDSAGTETTSGGSGRLATNGIGTFTYTVTPTSQDNFRGTTASITYTVAGAPTATISSPANHQTYTQGQSVPTSFSCADGRDGPGLQSCTDSNGATGSTDTGSGSTGSGSLNTSEIGGDQTYAVTATSNDGQTKTTSITYAVVSAVPTIVKVSPRKGPKSGGTPITITGTQFVAGATVEIAQGKGVAAIQATNVVVVSPTEITATTGGGARTGSYNVFVTTSGGTSPVNKSGDLFTYTKP
jgi:hypothetical protein